MRIVLPRPGRVPSPVVSRRNGTSYFDYPYPLPRLLTLDRPSERRLVLRLHRMTLYMAMFGGPVFLRPPGRTKTARQLRVWKSVCAFVHRFPLWLAQGWMCLWWKWTRGLLERLRVSGHDSEIPETVGATSDVPTQIPNQGQLTPKLPYLYTRWHQTLLFWEIKTMTGCRVKHVVVSCWLLPVAEHGCCSLLEHKCWSWASRTLILESDDGSNVETFSWRFVQFIS